MTAEAAVGLGPQLLHCTTDGELRCARTFRDQVFLDRRNMVLEADLERLRDARSDVFLLVEDGVARASVRAMPYPSTLSAVCAASDAPEPLDADTEVGRLTAVRSSLGPRSSLLVLLLSATWMLECTEQRRYVAHCPPALCKLYRLLGAQDTGRTLVPPGRSDRQSVVLGTFDDCVARAGAMLGMSRAEASAAVRWHSGAAPSVAVGRYRRA